MKMLSPMVGAWYKDIQTHEVFEVIDWDTTSLTIETQHRDGEVSEYDLDAWREMRLEEIERHVILASLRRYKGNKAAAARHLGVTARTLRNKMHRYREGGYSLT